MKYFQQLDITDCGAACLAMIASHYGRTLNIAEIRGYAGTDVVGTNIKGIMNAASFYGLACRAVKGTHEAINAATPVPFVVHLHIERGEDIWVDHFVVVNHIGNKSIEIWDPDPLQKKKRMTYEQFFEWWTGYALFFEPDKTFQKTEKKENILIKFLPIFLPHTKLIVYSFLSSILLMIFGIVLSYYYKYVFDEIIFSKASLSLVTLSIGILGVTVIQSVVSTVRSILLSHFSYKTDLQLNFSYISHIFKLPLSFFETRKSGEILSRLGDLGKIKETLSSAALSGVMDVVMLLVSGPILWKINSTLFSVSVITVLVTGFVSVIFSRIYRKYYSKIMSDNADVQSYLFESINGVSTVKALNAEDIVHDEYEKRKMKAVSESWKLNKYGISQSLISGLINGVSGILVFWLGSSFIILDVMSFGTLLTFNSLLGYFTGPLFRLVNMQNAVQESLVAAERVGEILELDKEQDSSKKYFKPESIDGDIEIKDITFRYGSRHPVYEHLSLKMQKGEWTAFVGSSGCGKTTLIKLLLKFYTPEEGSITIDGNDLRDIDTKTLRSKIGYVPQDIFLFSGTVRDNIALHHPESTFEEVMEAAKKSGAVEFIEKLPKRYDTVLAEHGGGLSGGEKQRSLLFVL